MRSRQQRRFLGFLLSIALVAVSWPVQARSISDDKTVQPIIQDRPLYSPNQCWTAPAVTAPTPATQATSPSAAQSDPLKLVFKVGRVHVNSTLNIRSGPWGKIIGSFSNNDKVYIIGKKGDWYMIFWHGRIAYCHSSYVSTDGTATPPTTTTPPPTTTKPPTTGTGETTALNNWKGGKLSPAEFVRLLGPVARESMKRTGVPASVTLAQAALETGWGKSTIGDAKNLFGIKGRGPAGSITVPTREYINGRYVTINDSFRKYNTWGESVDDHSKLLSQNSRYAPAMAVRNDADAFAKAIHRAGYATSPTYSSTLISIMKQYNLYQWDR